MRLSESLDDSGFMTNYPLNRSSGYVFLYILLFYFQVSNIFIESLEFISDLKEKVRCIFPRYYELVL